MTLFVKPKDLVYTLEWLKTNEKTKFECLVDMTAVDYPSKPERFELVYMLLSLDYNTRIKAWSAIVAFVLLDLVLHNLACSPFRYYL